METSRNWMFTINNYSSFEEPQSWNVKFLVYQEETGAEGTRHLQGYVMFPKNMRLSAVKKIHSKAHWEPRRGTHEQAVAYCTKQETRTGRQYTGGTAPDQGHRTDLDQVAACALVHPLSVVASSFPSQFIRYHRGIQAFKTVMTKARSWLTDLIIYWGPPRTGKSHTSQTCGRTPTGCPNLPPLPSGGQGTKAKTPSSSTSSMAGYPSISCADSSTASQ